MSFLHKAKLNKPVSLSEITNNIIAKWDLAYKWTFHKFNKCSSEELILTNFTWITILNNYWMWLFMTLSSVENMFTLGTCYSSIVNIKYLSAKISYFFQKPKHRHLIIFSLKTPATFSCLRAVTSPRWLSQ